MEMKTDRWIGQNIVCLLLYVAINSLFVITYAGRILPMPWLSAGLYAVIVGAVILIARRLIQDHGRGARNAKWIAALCGAAFIAMLAIQCLTDPYSIQIDRWSALQNMTDNVLNGEFPYNARTHKGNPVDPFPVQWAIHVPFYFLGNVGLGFFFLLFIFLWSVRAVQGGRAMAFVMLLLVMSPSVWYEGICRSDLMSNLFLTAAAVNYGAKHLSATWLRRHWAAVSVAAGLLGATRIITLLPCGILLLPFWLRIGWKRMAGMVAVFIVTLAASFAPFALWDPETFFLDGLGPTKMQSIWIPGWGYAVMIAPAVGFSLLWKGNRHRLYMLTAVEMILCTLMSYVYISIHIMHHWAMDSFSITYFAMCLPFVVMSISERNPRPQRELRGRP